MLNANRNQNGRSTGTTAMKNARAAGGEPCAFVRECSGMVRECVVWTRPHWFMQ